MAEKKIPVGQRPTVLRVVAGVFPFDRSVGGDFSHLSAI
jgi:hypothetical protein